MKQDQVPSRLNVIAFAQHGSVLDGRERLGVFGRLIEESSGDDAERPVLFKAEGSERLDAAGKMEPWLHLEAQGSLTMVCQRCLGLVEVTLEFERDFRFVATEALAEVEDEESEEDVLVASKSFDLLELIEDELLMDLPAAPMHTVCPKPLKLQAVDADFEAVADEKPNPFAVLQKLKKDGLG
jgi:uncharacterized protein